MVGLAGHGNGSLFSIIVADYNLTPSADSAGITASFIGAGGASVNQLSNIRALQFNDCTDIVAQTPGVGTVTSGNIAELYGAAVGRLPDVPGFAQYEGVLMADDQEACGQLNRRRFPIFE